MARFLRGGAEVEAVQWHGDNASELRSFVGARGSVDGISVYVRNAQGLLADKPARPGDWVIRNEAGDFSTCKADQFNSKNGDPL